MASTGGAGEDETQCPAGTATGEPGRGDGDASISAASDGGWRSFADDWLGWPSGVTRLSVAFLVATTVVALGWRYPQAIDELEAVATSNAELSYRDREVAGGNSVVADQRIMTEARARIPEDGTFVVSVGRPYETWSSLTASFAPDFARSFLLPRRVDPESEWVICYACDTEEFAGAVTVWEGSDGVSLLRRPR